MIGIIGAMEEEISKLKEIMENKETKVIAGMEFVQGKISGKPVTVVRSGIGKVNAAACTQILADRFGVGTVINTGIAGSLKNEINIGDIVLSTDTVIHDMNVEGFGYPRGQVPRMDVFAFPTDDGLRSIAKEICEKELKDISVFEGRVLSGDIFVSDKETKEDLKNTFGGCCTEMEGAAIAQVAYLNGMKALIVRAISDKADDSASMDYAEFERKAIENCVKLTTRLIETIDTSYYCQ